METWEIVLEELKATKDWKEVLDTEFDSGRYYELPWMIDYFREKGDTEAVEYIIKLEEEIEAKEGRKYAIGDKFIMNNDIVECEVEITDFDTDGSACVEYTNINYKSSKKKIPSVNIKDLKRLR
jgi:hypothetical protein